MIEDMKIRNMPPNSQKAYIRRCQLRNLVVIL